MKPPKILFVINEAAHYTEFKKLLKSSILTSQIDARILFDRDGYDPNSLFATQIEDSRREGFHFSVGSSHALRESRGFFDRLLLRVERILSSPKFQRRSIFMAPFALLSLLIQAARETIYFRRKIAFLSQEFAASGIDVLVLGEENILLDSFLYLAAAGSRLTVIYPYTIPNPLEMAGGAYRAENAKSTRGWLLRTFGGVWARDFGNRTLLLVNPVKILALKALGVKYDNPWVLNSGIAARICVESPKMGDLYKTLGVPADKLHFTGNLNDDIISRAAFDKESRIERLGEKYGLPPKKPLVVLSFPPNQFPLPNLEYDSYDHLVRSYSEMLKPYVRDYNFIVAKHPRISHPLTDLTDIGIPVAEEATAELVPLAHLYLASASATIRWAISAGVPVLNYDVYRHDYGDYDGVGGVITIRDRAVFEELLKRALRDEAYFAALKANQVSAAPYWGTLDGNSSRRLLDLFLQRQQAEGKRR